MNGDGFQDIVIGAPGGGANFSRTGVGYVVFGKASGFSATVNVSALSGSNGFFVNGVAGSDRLGAAVSGLGDVNGDGVDDIMIGAPDADPNGSQSGASYVIFGRTTGFNAQFNLAALDGSNGFKLSGVAASDQSGSAVGGAGDLNGDGFDDIVVGAYRAVPNGTLSGTAYVLFGGGNGFSANVQLSSLDGSNGFTMNGSEYSWLGRTVTGVGDVNGDGLDDLLVGADGLGAGGGESAAYLIFGKTGGFNAMFDLTAFDTGEGLKLAGGQARTGRSVGGAGDINGDGFDDFIIGASRADKPGALLSGITYVVFGQLSGLITPDISVSEAFAIEGAEGEASAATFTVTLSEASAQPITVQYSTADGVASADSDFEPVSPTTLTFNPGELSKTVTVNVLGDGIFEPNETFFLDLTNPTNATLLKPRGQGTIINDDPIPAFSVDDVTVSESDAGTVAASFTVSLSAPSSLAISVQVSTADGTAVSGLDYNALGLTTLNFNPGETSKMVSVEIAGDITSEPDETFFINLSHPSNAMIGDGQGQATILNDDPLPALTIGDVNLAEGNDGVVAASFTVNLSQSFPGTVTVEYATEDGTAKAGGDYTAVGLTTLTFAPGETQKTITVDVLGDMLSEPDETFFVNLSSPSNATLAGSQGQATIRNDDSLPTISIGDLLITEGTGNTAHAAFMVSLAGASGQVVTVQYATADGTAIAAEDYTALGLTTLTFAPGETEKAITVDILGDTLSEADETFLVHLSSPTNATLAVAQGQGTIRDDDPLPTIGIDDVSVLEGDSGMTAATFMVSLSAASGQVVTIQYATADGTAKSSDDYTAIGLTTLTFAPGETEKAITVDLRGDALSESDETFLVNLSSPTNATLAVARGEATIQDDDPLPAISINDVSVPEGSGGTTAATFTVILSEPSGQAVTVQYATADGSGHSGEDYTAVGTGTLTFAPGETVKTITVDILGDMLSELDETFFVNLSNPGNATLANAHGQATIQNDDPLPTISIDDVSVPEGSSGTTAATFTVSLSAPSGQSVSVLYATADGSANSGSDYTAIETNTLMFAPGETEKTITIDVVGDRSYELDETFLISLSNPSNATLAGVQGQGTIINDDSNVVVMPIAGGGITFTDIDGDDVAITISKGILSAANFTFDVDGNLALIDLTAGAATFSNAKLTITSKPANGGDGEVKVGAIDASGLSLKSVKVDGDLGQIDVGEGVPAKLAVKKLTAGSLGRGAAPGAESTIAGTLGALKIKRDVTGVLNVTGGFVDDVGGGGSVIQTVQKVTIGGNLDGRLGGEQAGLLNVNGDIKSVVVSGSVIGGAAASGIVAGGSVGKIKIGGDFRSDDPDEPVILSASGLLGVTKQNKAVALKQVSVDGNVLNALILAGFGRDGAPANADAGIGKIIVDGNWSASSVAAGVADATADGYGINDALFGGGDAGILARIASITIAGVATGSDRPFDHFGITAEQIGEFKIGGAGQPLREKVGDALTLSPNFTVVDFA